MSDVSASILARMSVSASSNASFSMNEELAAAPEECSSPFSFDMRNPHHRNINEIL